MAFSSNSYQQLGFADRLMSLNDRERKMLEESWAGVFADRIFPRIDEKIFKDLYSTDSARPSGPVNVTVGALILGEIFDLTDEELISSIVCDVRYQMALRTTSEVVQPISVRTLQRFRKRCQDHQRESGQNLLRECIENFYGEMDEYLRTCFPEKNLDAGSLIDGITRARGGSFDYRIVSNPEVFKINVLPAHSDHVAYASEEEMEEEVTSLRYSLNGLWKFSYAKNYDEAVRGFEKTSYDARAWDEIRVPSHIQLEGYDKPAYINVQYPWDGREDVREGKVPKEYNPVGSYVKYFTVPDNMQGKPLCISFQGVESGFALWLNGSFVGYSEDSFTPSEFDLTPYLVRGENKLAVQVFKWTSSSWLEDQDMFRFSGIFRDVYLYTYPAAHIYDCKVRTLLDDAYENAELLIATKMSAPVGKQQADRSAYGSTEYRLLDRNGRVIVSGRIDNEEENEIREKVSAPYLWSAEEPYLYDLYLVTSDASGKAVEYVHEKVGFRRFELKDGLMQLNGKRIVFKGTNRHEFTCDKGRADMSRETLIQDLTIMKQNNINAIRTSHYPNDSKLYRLCDEFGLYLIAENNMETHGSWDRADYPGADRSGIVPGDKKQWQEVLLDRVNSCYQRDKNHPAILIWSCGNESNGGSVIYEMSRLFHTLDPDRLVHYEGVVHDRTYNVTSDMESQMYPPVESIRAFLKENPEKPFICCEYTHSMGNSNGAMFKYTDLTDEEPRYQGGFIWDFVDQSIREKDRYGKEYQAYGGDHLERPTDYSFSGNGIVAGDRTPYPKCQEVKFNYQNITAKVGEDQVLVINKNLFVSTDAYDCVVLLTRNGEKILEQAMNTGVAPLSEKVYPLPFAIPEEAGEYAVTVSFRLKKDEIWAEKGYEVAFGQHVFRKEAVTTGAGAAHTALPSGTISAAGRGSNPVSTTNAVAPENGEKAGATMALGCAKRVSAGNAVVWAPMSAEGQQEHDEFHVIRGTHNIGVKGLDFDVLFGGLNGGGLQSYRYGSKELIEATPRLNFWRPVTDNDKGNHLGARCGIWKLASDYADVMPGQVSTPEEWTEVVGYPKLQKFTDHIDVTYRYWLGTIPQNTMDVVYRVWENGTVTFVLDYTPVEGLPPMPEFGMMFTLNADYDRLEFYGNGPGECYCDRERGAKLGIWETGVTENMTRYLVPQECGNRTAVRWAKLTDRKGRGILFSCGDGTKLDTGTGRVNGAEGGMNFSALPYTPNEIENAAHHTDLPPVHHTIVRASLMQMGVAGDDSWGAKTHPEFLLPNDRPLHFEFSMRGI